MGHFSNGTEGMDYQEKYCFSCINYRDKEDGRGPGCAVWDAHLLYVGQKEFQEILDLFIPQKEIFNDECEMFLKNPEVTYNKDQLKLELK